ncbi:hypothetical protein M1116_02475 [Patescibacteria group bacterium]|nr:hypothetical protein [Patescibacteria group bacterium]
MNPRKWTAEELRLERERLAKLCAPETPILNFAYQGLVTSVSVAEGYMLVVEDEHAVRTVFFPEDSEVRVVGNIWCRLLWIGKNFTNLTQRDSQKNAVRIVLQDPDGEVVVEIPKW